MRDLADSYVHFVLESDEVHRTHGLDDDGFEELGSRLIQQRHELGQLLARGKAEAILPALRSFMFLRNIQADLAPDDERRAAYSFLQGIVRALDHQLSRHSGQVLPTSVISTPPINLKTWQEVFECWRDYVENRPKPTTIACNTAWKQLQKFAEAQGNLSPAHVTPKTMSALVEKMRADKLSVKTINERLRKIRSVYVIAMGRDMLQENPAERTLGIKVPSHMKGREKRKPFSPAELQTIFGSPIYTQQLRSRGQSGEATYWIPVLMLYTGARPEELAGLRVEDVMHKSTVGWYLNVTDLPGPEDTDLFEPPQKGATGSAEHAGEERRHLKNVASRRQIPLASELERLGLLRYVEWVKQQGSSSLFPTLTPDTHGKLSGAHSKFFGRLKRRLGINSPYKTLYSLRHNMKDFLEAANVPTRYLKRLLGHTTGDGTVTDGYGSGLPLEQLADHFSKVTFPGIPAQPWMPGKGYLSIR
jgi:integrase